jgi:hypothetical protein
VTVEIAAGAVLVVAPLQFIANFAGHKEDR